MQEFKKTKVAILGFEINGQDAAKFLVKNDANITVFDRKEEADFDFAGFDKRKIKFVLGENYLSQGLTDFDYIFRSPGVYRYLPEIVEAEKAGVKITSAVKLFFDLCPGKIIGVTGTKGKGTTSTLIYKILKKSKKNAHLAGNIGEPVLSLIPNLTDQSIVVLELSSFQLIDMVKSPHISVVLNITTDHMDWHKDRDEYLKSKIQIVKFQKNQDFAVLNFDYIDSKNFAKKTKAKVYYFSRRKKIRGAYVKEGTIFLEIRNRKYEMGKTDDLKLRGEHNWENVCAAVCASFLAGADPKAIREVIYSFKGLEHRLELIKKVKGVSFYNDSFSTNPQTTIAAVKAFNEPTTIILGGSDKGLDYNEMGRVIAKRENVKVCVLIGDIAPVIKKALTSGRFTGEILDLGKISMEKIVENCLEVTPKGGVVLLSPATASFDMFANYKERGKEFRKSVKNLE